MTTQTSSTTTTFDPVAFKSTTRAQWQDAADAWHRWGPRHRLLAGRGHRHDDRAGRDRRRLARPRRGGRRRRAVADDRPPGRSAGPRARHRHRPEPARARRGRRRGRRARPGRDQGDRRRVARAAPGGLVRRRREPGRPHLLPRPAAGAARHAARAAAGRPGVGRRVLDPRPQRVLLHPGPHHPRTRPAPASAPRPAGSLLAGRARGARGRVHPGGVHRRRGPDRAVSGAAALGRRVRALRAGVLRRPAPDDADACRPTSRPTPGPRSRPS